MPGFALDAEDAEVNDKSLLSSQHLQPIREDFK